MRRTVVLVLPLLVLAAAGLVVGQDGKDRPGTEKAVQREKQAGKPALLFDVDTFLKEHDADKDGHLSKDELPARFRHNFDKLDTNKDGKLSREELQQGVAHLQPRRRPSDLMFILVETSDCDECCAEELQTAYDFLRKLDANKDGKIDATELKTAREDLVRHRVDSIMKELDRNQDGKISREEARGQIGRHFAELDTNQDGFISRDELQKAVAARPTAPK